MEPNIETLASRLSALPEKITLEYLEDVPDEKTGKLAGKMAERTLTVTLRAPETEWTQFQMDRAQQLAWAIIQGGKALKNAGMQYLDVTDEEGFYLGLRAEHQRQKIFSYYYVAEKQKFFMDSTQQKVITAFSNAKNPFSPEEEAALITDFLERYTSSRDSTRALFKTAMPAKDQETNLPGTSELSGDPG